MKFGQIICLCDILDEFENGYSCLKNIAARGRAIFPNMTIYLYSKTLLTL